MSLKDLSLALINNVYHKFSQGRHVLVYFHANNEGCTEAKETIESFMSELDDKENTMPEGYVIDWEGKKQVCNELNRLLQAAGCAIPHDLRPPFMYISGSFYQDYQPLFSAHLDTVGTTNGNGPITQVLVNTSLDTNSSVSR